MKRKTKEEIKRRIKECIMNNNNIFNVKAIARTTSLDRSTVKRYKNEIMQEIRLKAKIVDDVARINFNDG